MTWRALISSSVSERSIERYLVRVRVGVRVIERYLP